MSGAKFEGMDEMKKKFEDLKHRIDNISGERQVALDELFNRGFMTKYTKFNTIDEMFNDSEFKIISAEDFKNIPQDKLDRFISEHSPFSSWDEMLEQAVALYYRREIGL